MGALRARTGVNHRGRSGRAVSVPDRHHALLLRADYGAHYFLRGEVSPPLAERSAATGRRLDYA